MSRARPNSRAAFVTGLALGSVLTFSAWKASEWWRQRKPSPGDRVVTSSSGKDAIVLPASASSLLDFFLVAGKVKSLRRTGWVDREVRDPESVADHMYRMALMALVLAPLSAIPGSSASGGRGEASQLESEE